MVTARREGVGLWRYRQADLQPRLTTVSVQPCFSGEDTTEKVRWKKWKEVSTVRCFHAQQPGPPTSCRALCRLRTHAGHTSFSDSFPEAAAGAGNSTEGGSTIGDIVCDAPEGAQAQITDCRFVTDSAAESPTG